MADKKYYLSKIRHKGKLLNVKDEEARAGLLVPVDISTLTPASTFRKNAVIGINGVLYRAKKDTANLPCTLVVEDGSFVTDTAGGKTAFSVSDPAPNDGWEVWTDAGIEYWLQLLDARKLELGTTVTIGGKDYTILQLLTEVVKLADKTVVTS